MLIVRKYGGTSVGSIERMRNAAARCLATARQGHQVAVVVSAMSGETNRLLKLAGEIHEDPNDREVDVIVSTGEQVSVGLVALTIRAAGGKGGARAAAAPVRRVGYSAGGWAAPTARARPAATTARGR